MYLLLEKEKDVINSSMMDMVNVIPMIKQVRKISNKLLSLGLYVSGVIVCCVCDGIIGGIISYPGLDVDVEPRLENQCDSLIN